MAPGNEKVDYLRQFRQMRCKGFTEKEVTQQVKKYRHRLDHLPSVIPDIDTAKQQADQFIRGRHD